MNNIRTFLLVMICTHTVFISGAQEQSVTVSGVILDADSIGVVPFVNIRLKGTYFGTVSDNSGYFNFTASEGDTLHFSSIGYFDAYFIMPDDMDGESYSLIQLMRKETVMLEEIVIFPWPEYEHLRKAFLSLEPNRSMQDISNEAIRKVKRISQEEYERNKYYYNVYHNNQLYDMTGIVPANNFINPLQWSNFIKDVKNKTYKKKE